ncbi:fructose-1,6-bisphosphatase/inositol monophosphatase family enzyme [Novosphingobium kunmingense]|uniref:Fructose-1,6-bisphosphatase/inositol monophosphatase family enzyme n=1 Tax=Novosphingobium kunmingense TaxID=1211806 RepID=A0A2N0I3C6_9SPHN|nr:inositol monophosphatase family protein [Novosphingobium kunmingense]PKB25660.1 fructose-1,6-bisphosphatase/inositol monophosphatase family enzyme [Novosphingobium kunmingense]
MTTTGLTGDVLRVIREAVDRAILPRFRTLSSGEIIDKGGNELVTIADREAEVILAEGLARLLPGATVVGEEAASADPALLDRLGDDLCWIIDPVDGTNNFASGKAPFGVMVALSEKGVTQAGWIYDPLGGRLCHAHLGYGAFVGEDRIDAKTSGEEPPIAAVSLVFMDQDKREAMRQHIAPHYTLVDIPRCAAEQYPRIALGVNDLSIFERTLAWDHAAGALFVNEAGGMVARPDGRPYRVDEAHLPGLIGAASPALFEQLAARLAAF